MSLRLDSDSLSRVAEMYPGSKGGIKPQKECGRARRLTQVVFAFLVGFIVPYYLFSLKISFINVTTQENHSHLWQQHTTLVLSQLAAKYSRDT